MSRCNSTSTCIIILSTQITFIYLACQRVSFKSMYVFASKQYELYFLKTGLYMFIKSAYNLNLNDK